MIRKTITRACLVSMLTVAPATQVSALQLSLPNQVDFSAAAFEEQAATPPQSILSQEAAKKQFMSRSNENNVGEAVAASTLTSSMFPDLDALVAASLLEAEKRASGESVNANYEATDKETLSYQISQATALLPAHKAVATLSAGEAESAIVIHPPATRLTAPNRHYFKIENTSQKTAQNVVVELVVPGDVYIIEVVPSETVVVGKTARYKFNSIGPGESEIVELTTNPSIKEEVVFESRFSLEHVRHLAARTTPHKVDVWASKKKLASLPKAKSIAEKVNAKPVASRRVATGPATNVLTAEEQRKRWKEQARLSYGQTGIPGKVMVANPQAQDAETPLLNSAPVDQALVDQAPPVGQQSVLESKSAKARNDALVDFQPIPTNGDVSPQVSTAPAGAENGWFQSQLKTKIDGPQHAVTGEEAEYQVLIENASSEDVEEVLVQLSIPTGIEITVLDRDAWFDGKARTITWKLPSVPADSKETIRYLAKMVSADGHLQKVTLGVDNQFRGQAIFQSTVMDQYELAAPLPPFEKDASSLK